MEFPLSIIGRSTLVDSTQTTADWVRKSITEAPYGWQLKQRIPVDVITEAFTYLVVARVRTVEIVR